jgi:hypothetical protein
VTTGLKLLEQIPIYTPVFTKPSPLGIRHNLVKVPWLVNYWIIDKDTLVKVLSTRVQSVSSPRDITHTTNQSYIASNWLPPAIALIIVDLSEPELLMKLPIFIENDSLRYDTSVLILDSSTTLNFVSQEFLIRNGLVGKCVRGPKIEVRIANEQRISTNKSFSPTGLFIHQNSSRASPLLCCHTSNVWTLSLGYQRSKHYKCLFNLLIILL